MAGERNIFRPGIKHMTAMGPISVFAEMPIRFSKSILRWRVMPHLRVTEFPLRISISTRSTISA